MTIKTVLVTGSSGTVGTRLCETMLKHNYDVIGFDLRPNKWNPDMNKHTIIGDLTDASSLATMPRDIDLVIHLAANARVYNLVLSPRLAIDNITMLFTVLEFLRERRIRRLIFASSREVYGNAQRSGTGEDEVRIVDSESPYAASKISGEALIHAYHLCYDIDFVIMRFSNVYGMYDESDRLIPIFIKSAMQNKSLTVFGRDKVLDFTYIDDTVAGTIKCIEKFDSIRNDVFNIASGEGSSIIRIADLINGHFGRKNEIIIKDNRTGEVVKFTANIAEARVKLGYQPHIGIGEGIEKTINWYMSLWSTG